MLTETQIRNIQKSWSRDTCYPPLQEQWSESNPALGQCAITALLLQELIGGDIVFSVEYDHYWNRIDDTTEIDLTRSQFGENIKIQSVQGVSRESLLEGQGAKKAKTQERYELLKESFNQKDI